MIELDSKLAIWWNGLTLKRRRQIITAWQITFFMLTMMSWIGGNILCCAFEISHKIRLIVNLIGLGSLGITFALGIWGDVLVGDKTNNDRW